MWTRKPDPAFEMVGERHELIACPVCGSRYMNRNEAWDCSESDMIRFIYEKLGGTYPYRRSEPRS